MRNRAEKTPSRIIDVPPTSQLDLTASGFTTEDALRFWRKVDRGVGRDDCWTWTGAKYSRDGYGGFSVARRKARGYNAPQYAHRVSYELTHGSVPAGLSVLHRCDNPSCVNPKHLFAGTQADNMRDASEKGRLHIERPNAQKLSRADLIEIESLRAGGWTLRAIAERMGVSSGFVSLYLRGYRRQLSKAS